MKRSPAEVDAALTVILVLDRLIRTSGKELAAAELDRERARTAARQTIAWMRQLQAGVEAGAKADAAARRAETELLAAIETAMDGGDSDEALEAALRLAETIGVLMPSEDLIGWIEEGPGSDTWVLGTTSSKRASRPVDRSALGSPCEPPVPATAAALLRRLTNDPNRLWVRPLAGAQLSIRRPLGFEHHGLYLGDGSVVHFSGEPGSWDWSKAAIERVPLADFLNGQAQNELERVTIQREGGRPPIALLRSGVACLRAAARDGDGKGEYSPLSNNCEHFATWALLGVPLSGQVQSAGRLVSRIPTDSVNEAETLLDDLGYALSVTSLALDGPLLDAEVVAELPVDIARARWAEDLKRMLYWFPVWDDKGSPLGGPDLQWSVDVFDLEDERSSRPPSIALDRSWHASLIAYPDGSCYWLTSEGEWHQERSDVLSLVEGRIAPSIAVAREMTAGPGRVARKLIERLLDTKEA